MLEPEQIMVSYYDGEGEQSRWDACAQLVQELRDQPQTRFLVYQQEQPPLNVVRRMVEVVRGGKWRVSMVSPSASMRFVASSFSLVVKDVRFFSPETLNAALDHLKCSPAEKRRASACLERLCQG